MTSNQFSSLIYGFKQKNILQSKKREEAILISSKEVNGVWLIIAKLLQTIGQNYKTGMPNELT